MEDKKKTSTNGQSSLGGNERRVVNELLYTIKCVNFVWEGNERKSKRKTPKNVNGEAHVANRSPILRASQSSATKHNLGKDREQKW